jgi:hypothetical protein
VPFNDVLTEIGQLESDLADLLDTSPVQVQPDNAAVDDFLVRAHTSCWSHQ